MQRSWLQSHEPHTPSFCFLHLAIDSADLAVLFKELATLVVEQGTILDRIDHNMETTVEATQKGVKELQDAEKYQCVMGGVRLRRVRREHSMAYGHFSPHLSLPSLCLSAPSTPQEVRAPHQVHDHPDGAHPHPGGRHHCAQGGLRGHAARDTQTHTAALHAPHRSAQATPLGPHYV